MPLKKRELAKALDNSLLEAFEVINWTTESPIDSTDNTMKKEADDPNKSSTTAAVQSTDQAIPSEQKDL